MKSELFNEAPPVIQQYLGYLETIKSKSSRTWKRITLIFALFFVI